jgi:hypothetical protein
MKDTHTHIDDLIRDQLSALPPAEATAEGWATLERTLDGPKDAHLRNALTGLAAADAATGWLDLASKLDHRSPAEVQLADRLDALQPTVAAGSWELLATKLEKENEKAVDAIVVDGLARSAPAAPSGWAALAARLELIGWRRSTVAAWKITEGALLLSLLLLLFRFGPDKNQEHGPIAELENGFPLPVASASDKTTEKGAVAPGEDNLITPSATKSSAPSRAKVQRRLPKPTDVPMVLPTMGMPAQDERPVATASNDPYLPEPIEGLEIRPLKKIVSVPSPMLHLTEIDNSVPVYYYANIFISPLDVNQVITPGHTAGKFDISSERRFTRGFTVGALLDINKGRNTLQIGAIYSRRAYLPASLKWRYQDYFTPQIPVEGYSKFIYHAIELPFNYKHTLAENDRWRVSARAGMSLSIIAKPEIRDQDEVVAKLEAFEDQIAADGFIGLNSFFPRPGAQRPLQSDFSSERELKESPKGWFEGGSILANSSFYLGGGVTLERIMNPRWSLYLSPSIGRVIYFGDGGVGPYRDRINLGSMRMGSRYRFGGKK